VQVDVVLCRLAGLLALLPLLEQEGAALVGRDGLQSVVEALLADLQEQGIAAVHGMADAGTAGGLAAGLAGGGHHGWVSGAGDFVHSIGSKPRPGTKGVYVELPDGLHSLLRERAESDRRKLKDTLVLAIEQYLGVTPEDYEAKGPAEDLEPPRGKAAGQADKPASKGRGRKGKKAGWPGRRPRGSGRRRA
jgi:hypothetical protein